MIALIRTSIVFNGIVGRVGRHLFPGRLDAGSMHSLTTEVTNGTPKVPIVSIFADHKVRRFRAQHEVRGGEHPETCDRRHVRGLGVRLAVTK